MPYLEKYKFQIKSIYKIQSNPIGDIVFKRVKTGPLPFNVEYTLKALACKPRPLTDSEREIIAKEKTIDEKYPRPSPEDVLKTLERVSKGGEDEETQDSTVDRESVNELGN